MADFMVPSIKINRNVVQVYPKFKTYPASQDLMIRGGDFYAIWIEERGLWSTNEDDALSLIDNELTKFAAEYAKANGCKPEILYTWDSSTGVIDLWHKFCQKQRRDTFKMLDESLIFSNTITTRKDYASKKLSYPLEKGSIEAYDKLISTLYTPEERRKIEWAIGAIVTGESKNIQKFEVFYGAAGTGKSTILNIIQKLFEGYYSVFDARALGSSSNSFALESFKTNPLVAIQHDGDLSRIEDNTRLNSLVSHELMTVNEKFKSTYSNRFKAFLFMGTNKPVKITDAKSGLIRRLIDVVPSGNKLGVREYNRIVKQIDFELGAIAWHCKEVFEEDPHYYDNYIPTSMLSESNDFYDFIMDSYIVFKKEDAITLKQAWEMYKEYCDDAKVAYPLSHRAFKNELKNYFENFEERSRDYDGNCLRSYYSGFRTDLFENKKVEEKKEEEIKFIDFKEQKSIFDEECKDCLAQYANENQTPSKKWDEVTTKLSEIDTSKIHYVQVPENHIVIDFDIKGEDGKKSFEKNLEAASKWPETYAELSKSGSGIHLHYNYSGDVTKLSRVYADNIEIKVFTGKSSLRRKLSKCNNIPIRTISSGLPMKGEKKVVSNNVIKSEKGLRDMIIRNMNKEFHPGTKPSIDFIYKILEDAYERGMKYDLSDMKNQVYAFAAQSTNQSDYCIKLVKKMHFKSDNASEFIDAKEDVIIFYDIEVFPNLLLVNWKKEGEGNKVVRMINPTPNEIEELLKYKLVGFNCRRYDNHIIYARLLGYDNLQLYNLSQRIINGERNAFFGEAYNLSYTDIYDYAATKQSLKKWEIELGIHHKELGMPWDQPVPEEDWVRVAEYCDNDVIATEAVWNATQADFLARQILADIAGSNVNDTTNGLTTKIIFGNEKHPELVYTDLKTGEQTDGNKSDFNAFPEYEFVQIGDDNKPHNMYRGTDLGYGGYVYAEPGIYYHVALLDIASLHPHSIKAMNCFGKYTKNFTDLLDTRIFIKHKEYDKAKELFNGKLAKYLTDESLAKKLSKALKIAINSVYGLTSANFDNPFRDNRNKNNIVALRGALFMRTLQDEVQSRGFTVAHIKTDSIKIPNATPEIIDFCMKFAEKYGYTFEHEATYEKMCLVNDAVYIAKYEEGGEGWTATGTQFQIPYVFKTMFSHENIEFSDLCETKSVKTALYLDMNENLPDVSRDEKELAVISKPYTMKDGTYLENGREPERQEELKKIIDAGHNYIFVGKVGNFCPIMPGHGGGLLCREQDGKFYSAVGSKGYRWLESEMVKGKLEEYIDRSYYDTLVNEAFDTIKQYGDPYEFMD